MQDELLGLSGAHREIQRALLHKWGRSEDKAANEQAWQRLAAGAHDKPGEDARVVEYMMKVLTSRDEVNLYAESLWKVSGGAEDREILNVHEEKEFRLTLTRLCNYACRAPENPTAEGRMLLSCFVCLYPIRALRWFFHALFSGTRSGDVHDKRMASSDRTLPRMTELLGLLLGLGNLPFCVSSSGWPLLSLFVREEIYGLFADARDKVCRPRELEVRGEKIQNFIQILAEPWRNEIPFAETVREFVHVLNRLCHHALVVEALQIESCFTFLAGCLTFGAKRDHQCTQCAFALCFQFLNFLLGYASRWEHMNDDVIGACVEIFLLYFASEECLATASPRFSHHQAPALREAQIALASFLQHRGLNQYWTPGPRFKQVVQTETLQAFPAFCLACLAQAGLILPESEICGVVGSPAPFRREPSGNAQEKEYAAQYKALDGALSCMLRLLVFGFSNGILYDWEGAIAFLTFTRDEWEFLPRAKLVHSSENIHLYSKAILTNEESLVRLWLCVVCRTMLSLETGQEFDALGEVILRLSAGISAASTPCKQFLCRFFFRAYRLLLLVSEFSATEVQIQHCAYHLTRIFVAQLDEEGDEPKRALLTEYFRCLMHSGLNVLDLQGVDADYVRFYYGAFWAAWRLQNEAVVRDIEVHFRSDFHSVIDLFSNEVVPYGKFH
ncbi:hypothetical protein FVE85_4667 [Porphyridium purpureum]|uniref:Uncharacterized protein n=1 Tax=Porphyridium purpureum TaxID=35688 RepID=A0A5J4YRH7_PORPP|nr:hypothetical protein FVE85_4667 [Porphyridium purpureum]|eukprot:POR2156..scf236_6